MLNRLRLLDGSNLADLATTVVHILRGRPFRRRAERRRSVFLVDDAVAVLDQSLRFTIRIGFDRRSADLRPSGCQRRIHGFAGGDDDSAGGAGVTVFASASAAPVAAAAVNNRAAQRISDRCFITNLLSSLTI